MDPLPPLPDYDLEQEIGGGPLMRVFAARHRSGEFPCALKLLRATWSTDPNARLLLANEARVGLATRHAYLVRTLDARPDAEHPFVVMELLSGETLADRILRDYSLDIGMALRFARQIAGAMHAMHGAGFVHGDIKPANIRLIDPATSVLMGLGQAHRPGELPALRRRGFFLGTMDYCAPELNGSTTEYSLASDWFSFGLTLAEMLTGELPNFITDRDAMTPYNSELVVRTWVDDCSHRWPRPLRDLIVDLLEPLPARRPTGALIVRELLAIENQSSWPRLRRAA